MQLLVWLVWLVLQGWLQFGQMQRNLRSSTENKSKHFLTWGVFSVEGKSAKIILYQGFNPTVRIKPSSWACDAVLTLKINELVLLKSEGNPKSLDNEKKRPLDEPGSRVNLSIGIGGSR